METILFAGVFHLCEMAFGGSSAISQKFSH